VTFPRDIPRHRRSLHCHSFLLSSIPTNPYPLPNPSPSLNLSLSKKKSSWATCEDCWVRHGWETACCPFISKWQLTLAMSQGTAVMCNTLYRDCFVNTGSHSLHFIKTHTHHPCGGTDIQTYCCFNQLTCSAPPMHLTSWLVIFSCTLCTISQ